MFKNEPLRKTFLLGIVLFLFSSAFISCLAFLPRPNSSLEMENRRNDPIERQKIEDQLKTDNDREYWKTIKDYRPNVINKQY
jgi:hypothetical protein